VVHNRQDFVFDLFLAKSSAETHQSLKCLYLHAWIRIVDEINAMLEQVIALVNVEKLAQLNKVR
jgi:uncharacterized protein YbaR (Trm112 family)